VTRLGNELMVRSPPKGKSHNGRSITVRVPQASATRGGRKLVISPAGAATVASLPSGACGFTSLIPTAKLGIATGYACGLVPLHSERRQHDQLALPMEPFAQTGDR
jgi:hypothetical protein